MTPPTNRLNLALPSEINAMLREIADRTGLKLTTIISQGIRRQHAEWQMADWSIAKKTEKAL